MRARALAALAALACLAVLAACSGGSAQDAREAAFRHLFEIQAARDPADGPRVLRIDDAPPDEAFLERFRGEVPVVTAAPGDARGTAFWLTGLDQTAEDRATVRGGYATSAGAQREFDLVLHRRAGAWVVTGSTRR